MKTFFILLFILLAFILGAAVCFFMAALERELGIISAIIFLAGVILACTVANLMKESPGKRQSSRF